MEAVNATTDIMSLLEYAKTFKRLKLDGINVKFSELESKLMLASVDAKIQFNGYLQNKQNYKLNVYIK